MSIYLQSIVIGSLLILLSIYLIILWIKKNYRNEYIYLIIPTIIAIIEIILYLNNRLFELDIFDCFIFYFLTSGSMLPIFRYLDIKGTKEKNNLIFLKLNYGISTFIFFSSLCILIFISLLTNTAYWLKYTDIFNFLYVYYLYLIELYVFYQTKNLTFRLFKDNWLTYVLIISLTELFNFFSNYNEFTDYFIIIPTIIIFLITRTKKNK